MYFRRKTILFLGNAYVFSTQIKQGKEMRMCKFCVSLCFLDDQISEAFCVGSKVVSLKGRRSHG